METKLMGKEEKERPSEGDMERCGGGKERIKQ